MRRRALCPPEYQRKRPSMRSRAVSITGLLLQEFSLVKIVEQPPFPKTYASFRKLFFVSSSDIGKRVKFAFIPKPRKAPKAIRNETAEKVTEKDKTKQSNCACGENMSTSFKQTHFFSPTWAKSEIRTNTKKPLRRKAGAELQNGRGASRT